MENSVWLVENSYSRTGKFQSYKSAVVENPTKNIPVIPIIIISYHLKEFLSSFLHSYLFKCEVDRNLNEISYLDAIFSCGI